jgi:LacI family purine nucleotide synthesis repressor
MPTINDVALKAGVSIATVSRVINNSAGVNAQKQAIVEQVIQELKYIPSIVAQNLRSKTTKLIGVVLPDYIYYYSETLNYIEKEARAMGYTLITAMTEANIENEEQCIASLIGRNVDGLILFCYSIDQKRHAFFADLMRKIPIVLMDQSVELPISSVQTDGYKGIKLITSIYLSQKFNQIALIIENKRYTPHLSRLRGFYDAFKDRGLQPDERLIVEAGMQPGDAYQAAEKLFAIGPPRVIITIDDLSALGVMKYCHDNDVSIPDEIEITGFDNLSISKYLSPGLTTIDQPRERIAKSAIELLLKKIKNSKSKAKKILFTPEIIIRGTTTFTTESIKKITEELN